MTGLTPGIPLSADLRGLASRFGSLAGTSSNVVVGVGVMAGGGGGGGSASMKSTTSLVASSYSSE